MQLYLTPHFHVGTGLVHPPAFPSQVGTEGSAAAAPSEWVPRTTHAQDKISGPAPILSSDVVPFETDSPNNEFKADDENRQHSDIPVWVTTVVPRPVSPAPLPDYVEDEELGDPNRGFTVVSAHLVEDASRKHEERAHKRKVLYTLTVLAVTAAAAFVAWPVVALYHEKEVRKEGSEDGQSKSSNDWMSYDRHNDLNSSSDYDLRSSKGSGDRSTKSTTRSSQDSEGGETNSSQDDADWKEGGGIFDRDFPSLPKLSPSRAAEKENAEKEAQPLIQDEDVDSSLNTTSHVTIDALLHGQGSVGANPRTRIGNHLFSTNEYPSFGEFSVSINGEDFFCSHQPMSS